MTSPGFAPRKYAEIKINPDRTKSRLRCRAILVSFVRSLLKKLFINYTPSVGPRPKGLFKERVAASRPSRGVSSQLNRAAAVAPEGVPLASWLRLCGCVTAACRTSSMGCEIFGRIQIGRVRGQRSHSKMLNPPIFKTDGCPVLINTHEVNTW